MNMQETVLGIVSRTLNARDEHVIAAIALRRHLLQPVLSSVRSLAM
jgi:hypothetical protein